MVNAIFGHRRQTPDPARVGGIVAAILVNVLVIVVLTLPHTIRATVSEQVMTGDRFDYINAWIPGRQQEHLHVCGRCGRPPPLAAANLIPITSPAPIYPIEEMRAGISGTVLLELLVGVDGRVLDARILHSSGNRRLDAAAREQILRNWRFHPTMRNGKPVQALGQLPVVFRLD